MSGKLTPFHNKNVIIDYPVDKLNDLQEIKLWYNEKKEFPEIDDDFFKIFLHACFYDMERTKKAFEHYLTLKAENPAIFANRDLNDAKVQRIFDIVNFAAVPEKSPLGYSVLVYGLHETDTTKFVFTDVLKAFCMFNDVRLSEDGLCDGYVVVFDMKGFTLSHLARLTLPALRVYMQYIQEAHPCRLRQIHIINTTSFVNLVMRMLQPLIRTELMSILHFHKGLPPEEDLPQHILPEEYGGSAPTTRKLSEDGLKMMRDNYYDWLVESEALKVDLSQKPKKAGIFGGYFSSFLGGGNVPEAKEVEIEKPRSK